ncbi:hypothetical protein VM1G_11746 [Cytospora mali]|uniref:Uncharacterized protein n=1 Tax=Cytospora mali TaxID=578113 RepID=A0A194W595_CYTMA|nr:hypothetical protein VM1G_11746 [Valsa mali]
MDGPDEMADLLLDLVHKQVLTHDPLPPRLIQQLHLPSLPLLARVRDVLPQAHRLVHHVGDEVVQDGPAVDRVQRRVGLDVGRDVEAARVEGDDGGVPLRHELVLAEALDVHDEVGRQGVHEAVPPAVREVLLGRAPVVLGQHGREGHLRDDVALLLVLEERRGREVQRQEEEAVDVRLHLGRLLEAQPVAHVRLGRDGLRLGLQLALEHPLHHAAARLGLAAAEPEVEVVEEPAEELDGVGLRRQREPLVGPQRDLLQQLVRRHVALEGARVPDLPEQDARPLDQLRLGPGKVLQQEVVPQRRHVRQRLHHDVEVVVLLDVVHAHVARHVLLPGDREARPRPPVYLGDLLLRVPRVRHVLDVVQALARDLVPLRQHVHLLRLHVDEHVVAVLQRVEVGVGFGPPALEVLAAHEARVDVDVGERDGAQLLEVEVQHVAVDGVQVQVVVARRGC